MRYEDARVSETALPIYFTTHAQTGAMIAPSSAFAAADITIHKDVSATERSSTAGFTVTSPFDARTGLHLLALDLSNDTDVGFWAVGSRYTVLLVTAKTVDGLSVSGTVLARFRILPAESTTGAPKVDVRDIAGATVSTTTAQLGVNLVNISGVAVSTSTAQLGTNLVNIAGSAVSASTAQLGVNVVNFGGAAGTFASGRPEANTSHIAGSAVSTTSAQIGVNVVQLSTDAVAADNAEAFFDGTGYAGTGNVIPSVTTVTGNVNGSVGSVTGAVGSVAAGGITTTSFAAGAIDAAAIAANAIGASELAAGAITAAKFAAGAIDAAAIADGAIDAATFAAGAIDAAAIATDAFGALELAAGAAAEIADAVWDEDIIAAHTTADTAGRCLRTLDSVSDRTNNATVNALLGVADTAGADVPSQVTDEAWDELTSAHVAAGSFGLALGTTMTTAANADAVWDEALSGHTTAGTTGEALGAFTGGTISAAAAQKVADTILGRSLASARASGVGDAQLTRSLIGALAKLVNKVDVNDTRTTLRIYDETDATVAWTQTITTDPNASPINSVDTV